MDFRYDCVVIGGGPAGLAAAIYLARFMRNCIVVDAGSGRAAAIPESHNLPGFPEGVNGAAFLERMRAQAVKFDVTILSGEVDGLEHDAGGFTARFRSCGITARTVLLATGVINYRPKMAAAMHDEAVARGLIRYCPVCDGYEARDLNIAVLGSDDHGAAEAEFLSGYSKRITLLSQKGMLLSDEERAKLLCLGVKIADTPVRSIKIDGGQIIAEMDCGSEHHFDTMYPALGSCPRAELAIGAGASVDPDGCVVTNAHQQTTVSGLFAAGDVVEGLDQISVAVGQGAKAATAIHNLLRERDQALITAKRALADNANAGA